MFRPPQPIYAFEEFTFDPERRTLSRAGKALALPPKALDVLLVLLEAGGRVVAKDELMRRVWPDTFVEEGNLTVNIFTLRKALGEPGERFIQTIPKRGYCFTAPVTVASAAPRPEAQPKAVGQSRVPFRLAFGALLSVVVALTTLSYVRTTPQGDLALPGRVRTVAVLSFASPGAAVADEYIGPGLAAAVATALTPVPHLIVRPAASTMKYGDGGEDPIDAGRQLRVDALLHGTARRTGESLAVSATLVRVADGMRLWTWTSTESMISLPAIERTIALGAATALDPDLSEQERAILAKPRTSSPQAYTAYLQGRAAASRMTVPDVEVAVDAFARAAAADPGYADAHAGLAAFLTLPLNAAPFGERYTRGQTAARAALALDDRLADPHTVLGRAAVAVDWDWAGAEREFKAAIARTPYDAEPHFWYALQLSAMGRHDDALAEIRFAQQVDPTSSRINLYVGTLLLMARRYEDALAQLRRTPLEMGSTSQQVYVSTALAQALRGRADQALATLERPSGRATGVLWNAHLAYVYATARRSADAERVLEGLSAVSDPLRPAHTMVAAAYACLGRMDDAFARIERAYADRESRVIFLNVDPTLDCARADPRFAGFVRRIGLDPRR